MTAIRLTSLRMRQGDDDPVELARDAPEVDSEGDFVNLLDLPVQVQVGTEFELRVRWVDPPPDEDDD